MPTLDSTSTLAEIEAAYFDSLSYAELSDAAKAATFITAANMLLFHRPKRIRQGQNEIEFDSTLVSSQLKTATAWLASSRGNASSVRFLGTGRGFRG